MNAQIFCTCVPSLKPVCRPCEPVGVKIDVLLSPYRQMMRFLVLAALLAVCCSSPQQVFFGGAPSRPAIRQRFQQRPRGGSTGTRIGLVGDDLGNLDPVPGSNYPSRISNVNPHTSGNLQQQQPQPNGERKLSSCPVPNVHFRSYMMVISGQMMAHIQDGWCHVQCRNVSQFRQDVSSSNRINSDTFCFRLAHHNRPMHTSHDTTLRLTDVFVSVHNSGQSGGRVAKNDDCYCSLINECPHNGGFDGAGLLDIRIVNTNPVRKIKKERKNGHSRPVNKAVLVFSDRMPI